MAAFVLGGGLSRPTERTAASRPLEQGRRAWAPITSSCPPCVSSLSLSISFFLFLSPSMASEDQGPCDRSKGARCVHTVTKSRAAPSQSPVRPPPRWGHISGRGSLGRSNKRKLKLFSSHRSSDERQYNLHSQPRPTLGQSISTVFSLEPP